MMFCGLILLCREIICWYWKMNQTVALLESIDASLRKIAKHQRQKDRLENTFELHTNVPLWVGSKEGDLMPWNEARSSAGTARLLLAARARRA